MGCAADKGLDGASLTVRLISFPHPTGDSRRSRCPPGSATMALCPCDQVAEDWRSGLPPLSPAAGAALSSGWRDGPTANLTGPRGRQVLVRI